MQDVQFNSHSKTIDLKQLLKINLLNDELFHFLST